MKIGRNPHRYPLTIELNGLTFEAAGTSVQVWDGSTFVDSFDMAGVLVRNLDDLATEAVNWRAGQ